MDTTATPAPSGRPPEGGPVPRGDSPPYDREQRGGAHAATFDRGSAVLSSSPDDYRSVLASVDKRGRRRWVYADLAGGLWRRRRLALGCLLIGFYLALPFLTVGGEPLLRIDIPRRHYVVLGHTFWPQDFFVLLLLVLSGIVATLLLVALFGRVFCGWLCPHNVFLEQVFRRIEQWCEGPAHRRAMNDRRRPRPPGLALRKAAKWGAYVLVAGALANTATALFIGTEDFRWGFLVDAGKHPTAALFFAAFFAINLFNFGWFREQTCTIVCPYGRLQTALLDADTLAVAYDARRGEPRGRPGAASGDCVDCRRCVQVCPTGIDIRNGNQLECIHCTACIDACDAVMARLARPGGLVRYASERSLAGARLRLLRPRVWIYAAVLAGLLAALTGVVLARDPILVVRLRDQAVPVLETGAEGHELVRAVVRLALVNRTRHATAVGFAVPPGTGVELAVQHPRLALAPMVRREELIILRMPRPAPPGTRIRIPLTVVGERGERVDIPVEVAAP